MYIRREDTGRRFDYPVLERRRRYSLIAEPQSRSRAARYASRSFRVTTEVARPSGVQSWSEI